LSSLIVKSIIIFLFLGLSLNVKSADDSPRSIFAIPAHEIINSERAYNPISGISPIALNQNRLGISYSNRYLLKETNTFLGFGSYNFKFISIGFSANYFGNQAFWYSTQSFLLAKKLNEKLSFGISFSHSFINQGAIYSNIHQYSPSIGISFNPMKNWKFSTALRNISHKQNSSFGYNDFVIGMSYFVKSISLHTQVEKMQNAKTQFDFMGEYDLKKKLYFLLRTSTGNEPISLGVECKLSGISMLFMFSYHTVLGSSPEVSMYKSW